MVGSLTIQVHHTNVCLLNEIHAAEANSPSFQESIVRMEDGETEAEDSATSSELLETLKENMDQNGGTE